MSLGLFLLTTSGAVTGGTAGLLLSAVGAVVLNLVLALNHRPGRYLGA